ncbi:SAM pointed domain-containing Ets transcription factor-like protein [Dinothrombium tinctorium]|uniref:SAM pointed domain-containing Ets transcription factor-like protein n=1 Tax=Dinothrombium tinctorium TaxID=1965070 RepID=A0A443RF12_9ACAR|nr:SAM pointed domain-containing Ets transcription factor-like protein [Dinothrombium tinctorium]RWS07968.1 SAM pointed domain-containing Ets transcription factor-like protein [Dinothrombium tinctorium]RWS13858.1 SAM pointed domain-containing Ets transcription factor-like protein [Dinothrombium tinctorium]
MCEEFDFNVLYAGFGNNASIGINNDVIIKSEEPSNLQLGFPLPAMPKEIEDLTINLCGKEIDNACYELGISADPYNWNSQDVQKWLVWQIRKNKLPAIRLEYFKMDGMALCSLKQNDFQQRAPDCGESLYFLLDIWKTGTAAPLSPKQLLAYLSLLLFREAADLAPQTYATTKSFFKPEESVIDLNAFLEQWSAMGESDVSSTTNCVPQVTINGVSPQVHNNSAHRFDFGLVGCRSPSTPCSSPKSLVGETNNYANDASKCSLDASIVTSDYGSEGTQSDDDISEDGCEVSSPSSVITAPTPSGRTTGSHIHLWQFLKELLSQPQEYGSCIRWTDRQKGIFKIEDSVRVARLWGKRKNRPAMNYDKLSRSIRQYYKKGIMKKTERSQRLVYQFCHPYCL